MATVTSSTPRPTPHAPVLPVPLGTAASSGATAAAAARRRRRVLQSVFKVDISQPTPHSTPSTGFVEAGQPFGGPSPRQQQPNDNAFLALLPSRGEDQARWDRAWHTVTSRIQLPASVAAEDSFGTLAPPDSQYSAAAAAAASFISASQQRYFEADDDDDDESGQDVSAAPPGVTQRRRQAGGGTGSRRSPFAQALRIVLNPAHYAPSATHTESIVAWHAAQCRRHVTSHVLPLLSAVASAPHGPRGSAGGDGDDDDADRTVAEERAVLLAAVRTLEAAHRLYGYGLELIVRGIEREEGTMAARRTVDAFASDLHAVIGNSVSDRLGRSITVVAESLARLVLWLKSKSRVRVAEENDDPDWVKAKRRDEARAQLVRLAESLNRVGLAGEKFQVSFAEIMDGLMREHISATYAGVWDAGSSLEKEVTDREGHVKVPSPSRCIAELCNWVESQYYRLISDVFDKLDTPAISKSEVDRWNEIAVGRLASLRISELFDIVVNWPHSRGGLDDLRASVTTPHWRLYLTDSFSAALQRRLLHPGRSTLEILQVYIAMIRTFHVLDQSKVLLDRVVQSLQLYLCQREDVVRIIVTGLLCNPAEVQAGAAATQGKLGELAVILNDPAQQQQQRRRRDGVTGTTVEDDDTNDWDDMSWVPDPVDAGVNYQRPRSEDVIGTMIGSLGSQETFIREFQVIIAERLLSAQSEFFQEGRVLSLLKKRFGEPPLQNCDVMIKDIADSRRLNAAIAKASQDETAAATKGAKLVPPAYSARILSRLYWPTMSRDDDGDFAVPPAVAEARARFEKAFEAAKASRKLTWLPRLGQVDVELEFADGRTFRGEVATYEAAVIYQFGEAEDATEEDTVRTVSQLVESLAMPDDLVLSALGFWVSRKVLRLIGPQTYVVVEHLEDLNKPYATTSGRLSPDMVDTGSPASGSPACRKRKGTAATSAPPAMSAAAPSGTGPSSARAAATATASASGSTSAAPAKKIDKAAEQQQQVYWQFIVGMLTNASSTMPLTQMSMMLRMLIADGFPWSNEQLQEFLAEKVAEGELEIVAGGKYKLVKK